MKIAIIGSGIAGLSAAYALSTHHDVDVFEVDSRIGGHSNTAVVPDGKGNDIPVDTGFIVYNSHNYPNLIRLFEAEGVPTEESDMSFAISIGQGAIEYFGDFKGMFAQKRNFFRPSHWLMIRDILDFYKKAPDLLPHAQQHSLTVRDLLDQGKYSRAFKYRHILPMAGAIWSMPVERVNEFPAEALISFFENHKLFDMDLLGRPVWRTVSGGSREYVSRITKRFANHIHTNSPVRAVRRTETGVTLSTGGTKNAEAEFDQVIFACHTDQALAILGNEASPAQREVLCGIPYEENTAVLHSDLSQMPKRRKAWASWNYIAAREAHSDETLSPVALTYWMNRLQNLDTVDPVLVTLNPVTTPDPEKTYATINYAHPQFMRSAMSSQAQLRNIQGQDGIWFCGAWCGHGFHEDGAASGFAVAAALGSPTAWAGSFKEMSPAAENATPRAQAPAGAMAAE